MTQLKFLRRSLWFWYRNGIKGDKNESRKPRQEFVAVAHARDYPGFDCGGGNQSDTESTFIFGCKTDSTGNCIKAS